MFRVRQRLAGGRGCVGQNKPLLRAAVVANTKNKYFIISKPFISNYVKLFEVIKMERKLMRVSEAAEKVYGCTKQNLYKLIRMEKLKTYKRYGVTVVSVDEVEKLAREIDPRGGDRKFKPKKV
jgi:hypothetical protein